MAYPGILFGGGGSTNSVEDRGRRERGSRGVSSLVRGSGGSCNLVQEISFHIVKFFYRTIVLAVVLYGCEAWSLTLREERKLRVF